MTAGGRRGCPPSCWTRMAPGERSSAPRPKSFWFASPKTRSSLSGPPRGQRQRPPGGRKSCSLRQLRYSMRPAGTGWVAGPRYARWAKAIRGWPGRLLRWLLRLHPKEPPVACDIELTRFLSRVVEPTAVILYCSTIVEDKGAYSLFTHTVLEHDGDVPRPVDRRDLRTDGARKWALRCLSALLADQRVDNSRQARLEARLYRTQYRAPFAPNPRAHYGLACMLSRLATQADKRWDWRAKRSFLSSAAAQLERSLSDSPDDRREGLAEWARLDSRPQRPAPTLRFHLRHDRRPLGSGRETTGQTHEARLFHARLGRVLRGLESPRASVRGQVTLRVLRRSRPNISHAPVRGVGR